MQNGSEFLWRAVNSIMEQTFKDYEIVIVKEEGMARNSNTGITRAKGDLVKILYMDDWFAHPKALQEIVDNFDFMDEWMITGADTNPHPYWTDDIQKGNNKLGSPSALTMRKSSALLFDERMSWLLDCDLYKRMYEAYGEPKILDSINVNIGVGAHQATHILTDEEKLSEHNYMNKKYV